MSLLDDTIAAVEPLDEAAMAAARARQDTLTKPQGALGRLEDVSVRLAGMTGQAIPRIGRKVVLVFAADHGVTAEGVSAYPSEVTPQMVANFAAGGAAINVLARHVGAEVRVVDMGVGQPTGNIARGPAMSREQALACVERGIAVANEEIHAGATLLATGDMGIGNTTASSAVVAAITGHPARQVTGRGTGVSDEQFERKVATIEQALRLNQPDASDGLDVLAKVGGFEIAGIAGLILGGAARRVPVVVDGFISGAGQLVAAKLCAGSVDYTFAAHRSVEVGHTIVLNQLGQLPLLSLDMRLGEGTGAALAMSIVEASAKILAEMATFGDAGVSEAEDRAAAQPAD
ncbi:MAG TPA: nicotinate-nucleotide--dimethylbenzimidazole phosphoribosyltransferase [Chloroflexota bacterium]|nr:nicotinate-nucleotide--dimethylbenzimidazole phosphoribosyltransferase [Chloroflexota bacterium]